MVFVDWWFYRGEVSEQVYWLLVPAHSYTIITPPWLFFLLLALGAFRPLERLWGGGEKKRIAGQSLEPKWQLPC